MNEIERNQKYLKQTHEIYAAIGRFVVQFEHVCLAMQSVIIWVLDRYGLHDQDFSNALLCGLTARPLYQTLASVLAKIQPTENIGKQIVDNIVKRLQKLVEQRNDIIHRAWFVG